MRKFYMFSAALLITAAFTAANLMANPAIMKKHAGKSKDGKKIGCTYCHNIAKIEKKGGQNLNALKKKPQCLGSGCHQ
jgi:cytochrome c2